MIPDDVEKVIMTKEDYDRNVEQLLLEKINAEKEAEQLNYIITELKRWLEMHIESYKFYGDYERADAYDMLLYRLKELIGEKEEQE